MLARGPAPSGACVSQASLCRSRAANMRGLRRGAGGGAADGHRAARLPEGLPSVAAPHPPGQAPSGLQSVSLWPSQPVFRSPSGPSHGQSPPNVRNGSLPGHVWLPPPPAAAAPHPSPESHTFTAAGSRDTGLQGSVWLASKAASGRDLVARNRAHSHGVSQGALNAGKGTRKVQRPRRRPLCPGLENRTHHLRCPGRLP